MTSILFTLNTVCPVFIIILIGVFLKKIKFIDDNFISTASKIVFNIALPALIFIKIAQTNFNEVANLKEILFCCIGVIISYIIAGIISFLLIKDNTKIGVFIQGAARGNYAIFGIAIMFNIFGDAGISKAAIILAFSLPLANILAITSLIIPMHKFNFKGIKKILFKIITNPNIIATVFGLIFSYFKIPITKIDIIKNTVNYLSGIALPLALIGVGASLNFSNIKENIVIVFLSTAIKIIILPAIFTTIAVYMGFRNESLVAIFLQFAVPTAVSSYIFAMAMDCDSILSANIIVMTTLCTVVTISAGILILKMNGLIY